MAGRRDFHKVIIGRSEQMSFVDYSLKNVPAKTDTGAYRSAVHATNINLDKATGELSFNLLGGHSVCDVLNVPVTVTEYKVVTVSNSFGEQQQRYEVRLRVKLGPKIFTARFTLADRAKKIYPILIGRKLLNGRFLVDPNESSLNRVELKEKYGIEFPDDEEDIYNEDSDLI
jgi:hypothetical protein